MIDLDGAIGEGGGQIVRSALTLSLLTGLPFRLKNVRAGRSKPGLRPQHIEAIHAAETMSEAQTSGVHLTSQSFTFSPGEVRAGRYRFDIRTAGSAPLVLQTILIPLCLADQDSEVSIRGGTHVPWSPCAEYLEWAWLPALAPMGFKAEISCDRVGFFPRGGGLLRAKICARAVPSSTTWVNRSALSGFNVLSGVANLPSHIAERQAKQAQERLRHWEVPVDVRIAHYDAIDRGTVLLVQPVFELGYACFFGLGERGKPAEVVAGEATDQLAEFLACDAVVDPFLADQILIPLALASDPSEFTTSAITKHLTTNAFVLERFVIAEIEIDGHEHHPGRVTIHPQNDYRPS
jgi:RNA 3'-terminal phosphate cyclase (ATP)